MSIKLKDIYALEWKMLERRLWSMYNEPAPNWIKNQFLIEGKKVSLDFEGTWEQNIDCYWNKKHSKLKEHKVITRSGEVFKGTATHWYSPGKGMVPVSSLDSSHLKNIITYLKGRAKEALEDDSPYPMYKGNKETYGEGLEHTPRQLEIWLLENCFTYPALRAEAIKRKIWNGFTLEVFIPEPVAVQTPAPISNQYFCKVSNLTGPAQTMNEIRGYSPSQSVHDSFVITDKRLKNIEGGLFNHSERMDTHIREISKIQEKLSNDYDKRFIIAADKFKSVDERLDAHKYAINEVERISLNNNLELKGKIESLDKRISSISPLRVETAQVLNKVDSHRQDVLELDRRVANKSSYFQEELTKLMNRVRELELRTKGMK